MAMAMAQDVYTVNWLGVISAMTALVAVVIGPVVTVWLARRRMHVDLVSTNRQEWINTLRVQIAETISAAHELNLVFSQTPRDNDRIADLARRGTFHESMVMLLINPEEPDHCELRDRLNGALEAATSGEDVGEPVSRAVACSQRVLKREWERVKKGE